MATGKDVGHPYVSTSRPGTPFGSSPAVQKSRLDQIYSFEELHTNATPTER